MKRRDFLSTSIGASLLGPLEALAEPKVTYLESEDLTGKGIVADGYALNFMALGDWGRNGEFLQLEVGKQMGAWAGKHRNNFVVSVGDNFYPKGVISEHDPLWHYSFENVYTAYALQCDWYAILGNHDYMTDPDAQIRYGKISRRWKMPARYYAKEIPIGKENGKLLMVMIDTNKMIFEADKAEAEKQIEWINDTLKQASADVKWKIVVGHHPYYTVGPRISNYETLAIRAALSKTFETHKVDVYLSGHEHSMQHLKPEGYTHQFISGAGSEISTVTAGVSYSKFQAAENGFMYFSMDTKRLNVKAINHVGNVLYETELTK
ncbi:3',5'-cyclic adenosine monophosphate phosphodiesterase CpdA [Dyadobacter sp. CECT 9275]|uniref:3',5'-cyclic adenosine monophosphate phosphodiesterase CpdA n=1 Tax=Dyadobacter helix TaxID=2822344 RepID=A0A916NE60_9BACT|nr:metallophosphoesterase [Dyadobacter sp. CECT 9275]CAG5017696.1 3',5'-cyclic adenosine monophosphate phosphodiesterase CpdA [Dyadobacter sp. CECT 9275]